MIECKELTLSGKNHPKEPISEKFVNGLNNLDYEKAYLFKALSLKDQLFSDGSFLVNEETFFPSENNDKSLIILAINSKVFCLTICLLTTKEDKKTLLEEVQNKLFALKDMPLETIEEKEKKIAAILDVISSYELGYVLIDSNNEINDEYWIIINKYLEQYKDKNTYIILDKKPVEVTNNFIELDIGSNNEAENGENKPISNKKIKFNKDIWKDAFNKNTSSFLLIGLEAMFSVFAAILCPYYFSTDNVLWGVIFLLVLLVCLTAEVVFLLFAIEYTNEKNVDKQKEYRIASITYLCSFVIIGIAISYVLFFVFKANNIIINQEDYNSLTIILSIVISILCVFVAIFSKQIYSIFMKLKKKIANRDNSHKAK